MINNYDSLLVMICTLILGLLARFLLLRLIRETRPLARLGSMTGLFLLYTAALLLMLHKTCIYITETDGTVQDYHQAVLLTILAANIAVLFVAFLYYAVRCRHRLSGTDKIRLMEL